jgi:Zn-dependent peptidase ImmA (M78 family)
VADTKKQSPEVKDYRLFELDQMAASILGQHPECITGNRVDIERLILADLRIVAFHGLKKERDTYAFIDTNNKIIFIDADLMDDARQEKKYRFTLAEELAHYHIHSEIFRDCSCPEDFLRIMESIGERGHDHMQSNARALASALLMPKSTVELLIEELARKFIDGHGHIMVDEIVAVLVREYDVNSRAARRRMINLGYRQRLGIELQ